MKIHAVARGGNPFFARIIITTAIWKRDFSEAREVLTKICECWPKGKRARFVLTSSGFINFEWAEPDTKILDAWNPVSADVEHLRTLAEKKCKSLITDELRGKLCECADFLSIGIDSEKFNKLQYPDCWPFHHHIEFIAIIDLKNNHYYWTGKSYPQQEQENGLIRNPDISSHFIDLAVGKTLIFACNDLMLESPRGIAATKEGSKRGEIRKQFRAYLEKEKPTVAVHHAHTTNDPGSWRKSFNHLIDTVPSVEKFSSNGVFTAVGETDIERRLGNVLAKTTNTDSLDFIVTPDQVSLDLTKFVPERSESIPKQQKKTPLTVPVSRHDLKELLTPEDGEVYLKILEWAKDRKLHLYWSPAGTFAPMYTNSKSDRNNLIFVKPNGTIQVQLKYIFQKTPFDTANKRVELIRKLNSLPALHVKEKEIGGTPSFPITTLQDPNLLKSFFGSLDWFLAEIQRNNSQNTGDQG